MYSNTEVCFSLELFQKTESESKDTLLAFFSPLTITTKVYGGLRRAPRILIETIAARKRLELTWWWGTTKKRLLAGLLDSLGPPSGESGGKSPAVNWSLEFGKWTSGEKALPSGQIGN